MNSLERILNKLRMQFDAANVKSVTRKMCMNSKHYPKGLDGRQRDRNGEIREKRGATLVKTLRQQYGEHVAQGYRSDAKLETVREDTGKTLSQILKKQ